MVSVLRNAEGSGFLPWRAHSCTSLFFLYSVFIFVFIRKKQILHPYFKYLCVFFDMLIISAAISVGCTYLLDAPPLPFLSIQAIFYSILILAGSFRYSVPCAFFSGIWAGLSYAVVVIINHKVLDLPYFFKFESGLYPIDFPTYMETFRVLGMVITGLVMGIASKRRLALFNTMIEAEINAVDKVSKTVEQTRNIARAIKKSTDEIFISSREIYSTANNQAASVREIESTIVENTRISGDIAGKTESVAAIASKMKNDVSGGFSVLELNIDQIGDIRLKNDDVISEIIELGNKIANIRDILTTNDKITDQTKVIAFNAALEAAGAGEHGRRFSVVASEVNRLTTDIISLTKQIKQRVEEMQKSSSSLIVSSEESAKKIADGGKLIKQLEDIFNEIRNDAETTADEAQLITVSTQKQQKSGGQINIAIADISSGLSSFINSTGKATSCAEELAKIIRELGIILDEESAGGEI
ncbi:MAG: methyl-accepting chemotaxis protein [Treponema sp.]|jgi:methyl-accepting chemotaxis protein|nr:methyl-accepting chemotaxis protein [Treponema sp.]